jgi:hypothetical protein
LVFHAPEVDQVRNHHNLLKDFEDEVPGYLNNQRLVSTLEGLALRSGESEVSGNLLRCYEALIRIGIIPEKEMTLLEAWVADIAICQPALELPEARPAEVSMQAGAD